MLPWRSVHSSFSVFSSLFVTWDSALSIDSSWQCMCFYVWFRSPSSTKSVKMSRGKAHLLKSGPRSDDMILRTANSPTSTSIRKSGRKSTESLSRSSIPKDNPSISHHEMSLHDTEPNIHSEHDAKSDASCKQARRKSARSASSRAKKQPSSARTKSRQTTRTQSRAKSRSDSRLKG